MIELSVYGTAVFLAEDKVGYKLNTQTDLSHIVTKGENGKITFGENPNYIGEEEVNKKIKQGHINVYNYLREHYSDKDSSDRYKRDNTKYFHNYFDK